LGQHVYRIQ